MHEYTIGLETYRKY